MKDSAYSYHMFMFPFTWMGNNKKHMSVKEFTKIFDHDTDSNYWEKEKNNLDYLKIGISAIDKDINNYYCKYQFFNEAGKNVILGEDKNDIVSSFRIKDKYLKSGDINAKYVINAEDITISLDITNIGLKIYNTGIAIFYINCENKEYRTVKDVKYINEYGRRVSLSFLPDTVIGYKKCADSLSIELINKKISDDFYGFIENVYSKNQKISLSYMSSIIRGILNENGKGIRFRGKYTKKANEIQICPVLDGKMYVSCSILDENLMDNLKSGFQKTNNTFLAEQEKNITELINVDLENECSYINEMDRKNFINKHLYFIEFGEDTSKLTGITEQACIKILKPQINEKNELINKYEIDYHNNIYNQIILIGIAQRMSIVKFHKEITHISCGMNAFNKSIKTKDIVKIMKLQERYVAFQSQFLLYEVTAQREGTYIYNKIQEELHIKEENETLSSRLSGLYELANINQGYEFSKGALILSLIAMVFTITGGIENANSLGTYQWMNYDGYFVVSIESIICILIVIFILKKYKK